MQRTRLNTLLDLLGGRIEELFSNSWRNMALISISLLLGFFTGSAVSTTSGQTATWDIIAAGMLVLFTEIVSRLVYTRQRSLQPGIKLSLWFNVLNVFKFGLTYSLFLEAFKLGS